MSPEHNSKGESNLKRLLICCIGGLILLLGQCGTVSTDDSQSILLVRHLNIGFAYGLDIANQYIYVTTNKGLVILDAKDPVNPSQIGAIKQGSSWFAVCVDGNTAYIGGESGFAIVDVTDKSNPAIVGNFYDGGAVYDIESADSLVLVADEKRWPGNH